MTAEHVNGSTAADASSVTFDLNGKKRTVEVDPDETLLETLRDRFRLLSPKDGCSPQGQCGCCVVHINGVGVVSCATKTTKCEGKTVITNEGLPEDDRAIIARCFSAAGGVQCGFCIPGFVSRTAALLNKTPDPTREQIKKSLGIHLCRCTGYVKILDAIELAAKVKRGDAELPAPLLMKKEKNGELRAVGRRLPRYLGEAYALGDEPYVEDMFEQDMLHGALRLSDHPRAVVKKIDTRNALALPGVVAIATAEDVRGTRRYGLIEQDWPSFIADRRAPRASPGDVICDRRRRRDAQSTVARRGRDWSTIGLRRARPAQRSRRGRDALADDAPQVGLGHRSGRTLSVERVPSMPATRSIDVAGRIAPTP